MNKGKEDQKLMNMRNNPSNTYPKDQSLSQNANFLAHIINRNAVPTFVINHEHIVTHWNKSCANITKLPARDVLGTTYQWKAFYNHKRPVLADLVLKQVSFEKIKSYYGASARPSSILGDAYEAEGFFPELGLQGKYLYFTAALLKDNKGKSCGAIETLQDITSRKKAKKRLKISKNTLSQMIKNIALPTFVIDNTHNVMHWNKACENLTKIREKKILGTQNHWKAFYPNHQYTLADFIVEDNELPYIQRFYNGKIRYSSTIEDAFEGEAFFPHLGKNGKWLFFTAAKIEDPLGNIIGAIETHQDITEKKVSEKKLKRSEKKYREAYNRAEFYKDIFAHDINNILQTIISGLELTKIYTDPHHNSKKIHNVLEKIMGQVKRGSNLVSNIRKLSKMEKEEFNTKTVKVLDKLNSVIKRIRNSTNKSVNIKIEHKENDYSLCANELLEDVFENLIFNAIKHNQNHLIQLTIKISKEIRNDTRYIRFEFIDNGIGIHRNRKDVIFQREELQRKGRKGMGLGLSLVKNIIKTFKGKIWVENRIENDYTKGSKFIILIPQA